MYNWSDTSLTQPFTNNCRFMCSVGRAQYRNIPYRDKNSCSKIVTILRDVISQDSIHACRLIKTGPPVLPVSACPPVSSYTGSDDSTVQYENVGYFNILYFNTKIIFSSFFFQYKENEIVKKSEKISINFI